MALKLNGTNSVAAPAYAGADADTGLQCGTNELKLVTGGTDRATIDSSGNFLLRTGEIDIQGGNKTVKTSAGFLQLGTSGSHHTAFITGGTERMRLDTSGRLLVGTTSADSNTRLHVSAAENTSDPMATDASIVIANTQNAGNNEAAALKFNVGNTNSASISAHYDSFSAGVNSSLRFFTQFQSGFNNPAERMRINPNGRVLMNCTATSDSGILQLRNTQGSAHCLGCGTTATGGDTLVVFRGSCASDGSGGATRGSISVTASATAYNTTSDYRLKENVVNLDGAITRVKQLQPKRFNFIADADTTVDGFLAHEAQIVVPEAVTGTHNEVDDDGNAVMQGIDQSKLVPLLTAALQEAIAEIETLKTKVAALEAAS